MSEPPKDAFWDVEIYKIVAPGEIERRFAVITTIGDANPVVHFCASREEAERSKYRTLEILWGVGNKAPPVTCSPQNGAATIAEAAGQTPKPAKIQG